MPSERCHPTDDTRFLMTGPAVGTAEASSAGSAKEPLGDPSACRGGFCDGCREVTTSANDPVCLEAAAAGRAGAVAAVAAAPREAAAATLPGRSRPAAEAAAMLPGLRRPEALEAILSTVSRSPSFKVVPLRSCGWEGVSKGSK